MDDTRKDTSSHIAIVGLACRFPGADSVDQFWSNLQEGKDAVRFVSAEEMAQAGIDPAVAADPDHVPAAYTLDDVEGFDASFFYLGAREAEKMDPQLRIFLETAWHALENAGYNSEKYDGDIGVFASGLNSTYHVANLLTSRDHYHGNVSSLLQDMVARMGNDNHYLATRTSYHLNLTGPSVTVQTACSSSLVAVHEAVESLLAGECDIALAGGVAIRFPRLAGYMYQPDGILSKDGHCRPFDAQASGTVFGDGAGIVVLKRLDDALAENDTIHAVILGSAIGNDGANKVGFSAPSVLGQAQVIEQAIQVAGVAKDSIGYIEAHGTATPMGDPIEIQGLNTVFGGKTHNRRIAVGSVKGNVGHLSIAAGMAGLIKTVMMLKHRTIVPTINYSSPNPECFMENTPFRVPQQTETWLAQGPLRAGLSSFGMGGTNCHVVLEEAPPPRPSAPARPLSIVPLSAKSPEALRDAVENAMACLAQGESELCDVAYTYAVGRRTFNYRCLAVAAGKDEASSILADEAPGQLLNGSGQPEALPVVFMFPGQGTQYAGMTQACYEHEPVFREVVDQCSAILEPMIGLDLRTLIFPKLFAPPRDAARLDDTQFTQPALFVIEYSLAKLWMSWGVMPTACIGHSVGEYVAACIAGVFSLSDALTVIARRGEIVQRLPKGAMVAVPMSAAEIAPKLPPGADIAAANEPASCTVAGPADAINALTALLSEDGVQVRKLATSHAFHSAMMEPASEQLSEILAGMRLSAPNMPIVSNLTGSWLTAEQATSPEYWAKHLRNTVRFADGIELLLKQNAKQTFVEIGPGQTLSSFVRRHPDKEVSHQVIASLGRLKQPIEEYRSLLSALGRLWVSGNEIDWRAFYRREARRRVPVPVYPFEHERYYAHPSLDYREGAGLRQDDKKQALPNWCYAPVWKQSVALSAAPSMAWSDCAPFLVFADEQGVADALTPLLQGAPLTLVRRGAQFVQAGTDHFVLRAAEKEDYRSLFAALKDSDRLPRTVIHLWSQDALPAELDQVKFEEAQQLGIYSMAFMVQAVAALNITQPMRWHVVTRSAYPVLGTETLCIEQSTVSVFAKVISQEYAHIDCRLLDVDAAAQGHTGAAASIATSLAQEVSATPEREYAVAYRGGRRWVQHMERIEQAADWQYAARTGLEQQGAYLITGGLGEIGATLARMLAARYRARLALLVREEMPPREQWDAYVANSAGEDLIARRIHIVRQLEQDGAEVLVLQADVADQDAMNSAMAQIARRFGRLDGVFHAAGLPGEKWDRTIENAGVEEIRWHFQTKAYGVQTLANSLTAWAPKFCVLISSIASMLGGLRLGPYGAANHYMDNFTALMSQRQPHTFWVAIDWDVWQHHQDEKRENSAVGKMMDERTVLPEQGMEVIERVLAMRSVHQVSVSTWDMQVRARRWIKLESVQQTQSEDKSLALAPASGDDLGQAVLALLNQTIGKDVLGPDDDFFEAGGDSLISLQVLAAVRERYGVNVSLAKFLSQPTAASLSAMIAAQLQPEDDVLDFIGSEFLPEQEDMLNDLIARIRTMSDDELRAALA